MKAEEKLPTGITRFPHRVLSRHIQEESCPFSSPAPTPLEIHTLGQSNPPQASIAPLQEIANILHLPVSDALSRLITEYATFGSLALQGEADAAHEWITDPSRNRHNAQMSVAFFRRWLKREQEMRERRHRDAESQTAPLRATGTTGVASPASQRHSASRPREEFRLPSLMHLAAEDRQARGGRR